MQGKEIGFALKCKCRFLGQGLPSHVKLSFRGRSLVQQDRTFLDVICSSDLKMTSNCICG